MAGNTRNSTSTPPVPAPPTPHAWRNIPLLFLRRVHNHQRWGDTSRRAGPRSGLSLGASASFEIKGRKAIRCTRPLAFSSRSLSLARCPNTKLPLARSLARCPPYPARVRHRFHSIGSWPPRRRKEEGGGGRDGAARCGVRRIA